MLLDVQDDNINLQRLRGKDAIFGIADDKVQQEASGLNGRLEPLGQLRNILHSQHCRCLTTSTWMTTVNAIPLFSSTVRKDRTNNGGLVQN
ncbi:hypothetical protein M0804_012633 [Polistes exclamans]|nr:hypothetical protein M0804_012633 [Polistes exclamans]